MNAKVWVNARVLAGAWSPSHLVGPLTIRHDSPENLQLPSAKKGFQTPSGTSFTSGTSFRIINHFIRKFYTILPEGSVEKRIVLVGPLPIRVVLEKVKVKVN